jgi:hypothetical protein
MNGANMPQVSHAAGVAVSPRLNEYLPKETYGIVSTYDRNAHHGGAPLSDIEMFTGQHMRVAVAGIRISDDESLDLHFPKLNPLQAGDRVTLHLDNRRGGETYDSDFKVYRGSYKGIVLNSRGSDAHVVPVEFQLVYSTQLVHSYHDPGYRFPADPRQDHALPVSPLVRVAEPDEHNRDNKLGVWITPAIDRPHTTVMAFLNSTDDDIFVVSHPATFKCRTIARDRFGCFVIDHRSEYNFEKAIDWNYTILRCETFQIPRSHPVFAEMQARFIEKNPWETAFFSNPQSMMFHLKPSAIIMSDIL